MNALADKEHVYTNKEYATQWYALHNTATLFNNHPYINLVPTGVPLLLYVA